MSLPTPEELRQMRKKAGLTQKELAKRAGVSQSLIARIEAGTVDPRLSTLKRIIQAINSVSREKPTAGSIMHSPIIYVSPKDPVKKAVDLMWRYGISQLPVIEDDRVCGSVREETIMKHLVSSKTQSILENPVESVMENPFPMVSPSTSIDEVAKILLTGQPAVLVAEHGKPIGIVTKIDIIAKGAEAK